jgi:hypothetical protein
MSSLLDEATATFNEILRMYKLNAELLETLTVTSEYLKAYAEKHDIPLPDDSTVYSLINKAETLTEEISGNQITDEFLHEHLNRRRLDRTRNRE